MFDVGLLKTCLVAVTTLFFIWLVRKIYKMILKFHYFNQLPGEPSFSWLYGNLHKLPKTGEGRLAYGYWLLTNINSKFVRFWLGPFQPNITVFHPDTVKLILKSSAPKARGLGGVYQFALPWIGDGLIVSNGATWARARRLLTPAFHFDILKNYVSVYNTAADTLVGKLDKLAESGESFDLCPPMTLCTLEIILKCAMSYDADVQRIGHHPYIKATRELAISWFERNRKPWLWPDFIFKLTTLGKKFLKNCDYVHQVAEEIINKRRDQLNKEGLPSKSHLDFLDILLSARDEDGKPMTDLEIRNEVDTFMFAGHDTTATAAPWIVYCLAKNPEYQTKVQDEIDSVLEGRDSDCILWSDISKLHFLALCIKEAMRLYPPVPFIQRRLNEDVTIEGHKIPAGNIVNVAIVHLHRNPAVWDQPHDFIPERFLTSNLKDQDSFSFTPFSAGSRNCIGQNFALNEEKVLIARLFRRYRFEIPPDAPPSNRVAQTILKSEHGLWFRIKKR
ncbi:cytochrome P450 4F6-like isoform X2 [Biomphalaria glabrata]|uniref:Cytochrome P450 4F6-like isoform X2 n=1 Tax=Biomphalaria glabrata TaxID=6526 RepID=A0A9U8EES0_BIOGL|nr:cytochrome P450 4F6-like isoform X2 [Biomphalaria glabrata]